MSKELQAIAVVHPAMASEDAFKWSKAWSPRERDQGQRSGALAFETTDRSAGELQSFRS